MKGSSAAPFQFLPLGAIIQTFLVGETNIVQNFPEQSFYQSHNDPYFGETIGRVANRIKNGKIDSLNDRSYILDVNNGSNHLHGGANGWGKRIWDGPKPIGLKPIPGLEGDRLEGGESVRFNLRSEDGEEGYPGLVEASVMYTAGTQKTRDGKTITVLAIEYQAELLEGAKQTVVNMTNHSYFNLSGAPSEHTIEGTEVQLSTNLYLPVDGGGIPTGGPSTYFGIEANKPFTLGPEKPDMDDCFVYSKSTPSIPIDTRSSPLERCMVAYHPLTGIHLEVWSTEPAFQFYTGKYIDVPAVEDVPARGKRTGFCVEPSRYVNAANVKEWKGQVLLEKGAIYGSRVVYRGWSDNE